MARRARDRYYTLGPLVRRYIESTCAQTKGHAKGESIVFEPWQVEFLDELFLVDRTTGKRVYSVGVLGTPAKNGKSTTGATLALEGLTYDPNPLTLMPEPGPEVYLAANARKQAGVIGSTARIMARDSEVLSRVLTVNRYDIENPRTDGNLVWLAADSDTVHGVNPNRWIYDELGSAPNDKLLTTLRKSTAARLNPLGVIVSHVGFERFGPLGDLYDDMMAHPEVEIRYTPGVESVTIARDREAGILYVWHGIHDEQRSDIENPDVWKACNPASWVTRQYLATQFAQLKRRNLPDFIRFHLNGFAAAINAWLPDGRWQELRSAWVEADNGLWLPERATRKPRAWIGVDAAIRYDLAAIVVDIPEVVDVDPDGIIGERPEHAIHHLRAEVFDADEGEGTSAHMLDRVANRIRELCAMYDVQAVAYDPYRFEPYPSEQLASEGIPVEKFPQSHERMVPASTAFRRLVVDGYVRHDGDRELARHMSNAITVKVARGERIDKSKAKHAIDAAVAAVMAVTIAELDLTREPDEDEYPDVAEF